MRATGKGRGFLDFRRRCPVVAGQMAVEAPFEAQLGDSVDVEIPFAHIHLLVFSNAPVPQ